MSLATITFFLGLFSFFYVNTVSAQDNDMLSTEPSSTPSASVDSFEIFWPMVAGKTESEPLYFLKNLKEQIRGWFIFGTVQKADYAVFLATKRVLEAEKLMREEKYDLAANSLGKALDQMKVADANLEKENKTGSVQNKPRINMRVRLQNIQKLVEWLSFSANGDLKMKFNEVSIASASLLKKAIGP